MTNNLIGKTSITEGHLTSYRMKLTTLSPVFIGGGEDSKLNKLQYFCDDINKEIVIIDENKLKRSVISNRILGDKFSRFCQDVAVGKEKDIGRWLDINKINKHSLKKYSLKYNKNEKPNNDIHTFIKNHEGNPYIPGSSLKGSIRTAILYQIVSNDPTFKKHFKLTKDLPFSDLKQFEDAMSDIIKEIEERSFCVLEIPDEEKLQTPIPSSIKDIFRCISISDSQPLSTDELILLKKNDLSTHYKGIVKTPKGEFQTNSHISSLPIFREYLMPGTVIKFTVTIDNYLLKTAQKNHDLIRDFWKSINQFAKHQQSMFSFFNNLKDNRNQPRKYRVNSGIIANGNISIGGANGFLSKSIIYALAGSENRQEAVNILAKYFDIKYKSKGAPAHKHEVRDKAISPRTLKLADYNNEMIPIGWCSLEPDGEV